MVQRAEFQQQQNALLQRLESADAEPAEPTVTPTWLGRLRVQVVVDLLQLTLNQELFIPVQRDHIGPHKDHVSSRKSFSEPSRAPLGQANSAVGEFQLTPLLCLELTKYRSHHLLVKSRSFPTLVPL